MIHLITLNYPPPNEAIVINTTSRSDNWSRGLSPFYVGPIDLYNGYVSFNMENAWQYSKVYEYFADENGEPGDRYFQWAKEGWLTQKANRYPMGRDVKPLYSYWDGKKLSYIQARREIYIPLYAKAVSRTLAFAKLKEIYDSNNELYLQDFDAHNLTPGTYDYWDLVDNENIKFGHSYVLAMLLEEKL